MSEEKKPLALKEINFEIKKESLSMIIGKVGSGKTAFFDLLLNELLLDKQKNHI